MSSLLLSYLESGPINHFYGLFSRSKGHLNRRLSAAKPNGPTYNILWTRPEQILLFASNADFNRSFRKAIVNQQVLDNEGKQELRIFFVFLTTGVVWFFGTGTFFLITFFPQLGGTWLAVYIEVHRYVHMVIDPLIYLVTIPQVRGQVKRRVLCQLGQGSTPALTSRIDPGDQASKRRRVVRQNLGQGSATGGNNRVGPVPRSGRIETSKMNFGRGNNPQSGRKADSILKVEELSEL